MEDKAASYGKRKCCGAWRVIIFWVVGVGWGGLGNRKIIRLFVNAFSRVSPPQMGEGGGRTETVMRCSKDENIAPHQTKKHFVFQLLQQAQRQAVLMRFIE